jgi:diacylglycerol kinase family enzyme
LVLVCGGDGTVNEVINGMVPGRAALGILPGGTANIAAKELLLPHHPIRAAQQLPTWRSHRIGLGRVTWPAEHDTSDAGAISSTGPSNQHRYFLSVAGVGFDAYVVYKLSLDFKMSLGVVAYGIEAVRQTLRHGFPPLVCELDGRHLEGTFAVIQRTRRYAGWLHLAPTASLFNSNLSLCVFTSRSRWRYFAYVAAVFARMHPRLRDVTMATAQSLNCAVADSNNTIRFEVDGELAGRLPAIFEVVPDALTLLAPDSAAVRTL